MMRGAASSEAEEDSGQGGSLVPSSDITSCVTSASGLQLPQIQNGGKNRPFSRVTVRPKCHGTLKAHGRYTVVSSYSGDVAATGFTGFHTPCPLQMECSAQHPGLHSATPGNQAADLHRTSFVLLRP